MRKGRVVAVLVLLMALLCATALAEELFSPGDFRYRVLDNGTAEIVGYRGKDETLEIPAVLDGLSVTRIGERAFTRCVSLMSITLPDSILDIEKNPFSACSNLSKIRVSPDHPTLDVIDGVLFSKEDKRLICYPRAKESTEYTVPVGVQIIGMEAFSGCDLLTNVIMPDSVTEIGDSAFYECGSLISIELPYSILIVGKNPFESCTSLCEIRVSPDHLGLDVIDGALFSKADKRLICYPPAKKTTEYTVPQGVRIIGESAFWDCDSLKSITLQDGVTEIDDYAFGSCKSLMSIILPDSVTKIGSGAFFFCDSLKRVTLPDGISEISDSAFDWCTSLTNVILPDSVTRIGESAFGTCWSLLSISLPKNVTEIGDCAFRGCNSLLSVMLPDNVTKIGKRAFSSCKTLISITLPSSVVSIGEEAFKDSPNLKLSVVRDSYAASYAKENSIPYDYSDRHDWLSD